MSPALPRGGPGGAPDASPRIVLYTKEGCSLCDEARAVLDALGHPYETATDERFAERVPVVEVDGEVVAELRVSERAVRRAVRRARRRSL